MELLFNVRNSHVLLMCLFVLPFYFYQVHAQPKVFNLIKYGGVATTTFDNSKALVSAWNDACKWEGKAKALVVIPSGTYLLNHVQLNGPCKGPIELQNMGRLQAPPGLTNLDYWINIRYMDRLSIYGGTFDGQGSTAWAHSSQLNPGHALMSLAFVNNTSIHKVQLQNSKKTHIHLFACNNLEITGSTISAPETSPNTDGIKMGISTSIRITDTNIASGDDCVAILTGTNTVNVTRVYCGPGHGISIGSMGTNPGDEVSQIYVTNCTFSRTMNGVRIKSWANNNPGICTGVSFKDIIMEDVNNPIIIDQNYCPPRNCPKGDSHVKIEGVNFMNINGTSASKVAINLNCSRSNPCENVRLANINLSYKGPGGPATVLCSNVKGTATRVQIPGSCVA